MVKYIHEWINENYSTIRIKTPYIRKAIGNILTISIDKSYNDSDEYLSQSLPFTADYVDEREAIIFDIINNKLSSEDKELILEFSESNGAQIAKKQGCSTQNINVKLRRITNKIKKYYDERLNG
jgi:hypothetical protein